MSDSQDGTEEKKDATESSEHLETEQAKSQQSESSGQTEEPKTPVPKPAPKIGTPIQQTLAEATPQVAKPAVETPVARPRIGTPIGTKPIIPSVSNASPPARPVVGTPTAGATSQRPTIGTPVGTARPAIGTPVGSRPQTASSGTPPGPAVSTPRPMVSTPSVARPSAAPKKVESKEEISRRNFLRGLAVLGGLVAIVQFGALGPYLQGSVESSTITSQVIVDSKTNEEITASTMATAQWETFVYPRTGNANIDNDTFHQFVIIKLPSGFTAPANLSTKDSSGNIYVGFSRVCVHLWCLWSYVPSDMRMECPCHGSQYVPGSGTYPALPVADNQPPGRAVEGPASLQTPPNNMLPIIILKYNSNGTFTATGTIVGQIGCGQDC